MAQKITERAYLTPWLLWSSGKLRPQIEDSDAVERLKLSPLNKCEPWLLFWSDFDRGLVYRAAYGVGREPTCHVRHHANETRASLAAPGAAENAWPTRTVRKQSCVGRFWLHVSCTWGAWCARRSARLRKEVEKSRVTKPVKPWCTG